MRKAEAKWVGERLRELPKTAIDPLLEIGSSTLHFRTVEKPHIDAFVHAPQRERGVRIVTADLRDEEGVDIAGSIYDPPVQQKLNAVSAKCVLICNILQHLEDRQGFADLCMSLVGPGGTIVVTVPNRYPYHLDPIDTRYRPNVQELLRLFQRTELVKGEILVDTTRWSELRERFGLAGAAREVALAMAKIAMLRGGIEMTRARLSALSFLSRRYRIACCVLRVRQ